ncbi:MAG TPA: hypothetical protein VFF30_09840 [Nitrososphaerales archaeon]|nr:hypothetical protein [Nitrososphaerales archaeon]
MARPNQSDLQSLEDRIQNLKNALSQISEERWRATHSRDHKGIMNARIKASEKTLENCTMIASYLDSFSPPLSHEIRTGEQHARSTLEQVKRTGDINELHRWIKMQLIPQARLSERLGHLAASSMLKARGGDLDFHKWWRPR